MSLRVDDFKSRMQGGGARPNLFKVTLTNPPGVTADVPAELMSFMCKGAALPASVVAAIEVPFRGRVLKVAGDRTFENWTVTIINDNSFEIRDSMERWMNSIIAHSGNIAEEIDPGQYQADMSVTQLNRKEEETKVYNIVGAFPVNVSEIELSYDSNDAIEEFTVEFAYQYWTASTTDSFSG